jgi:predicted nucleic acid-binding protein
VRGILDTSVLIAMHVGPLEGELAISAASLAELHYGVLVARTDDDRATRLARLADVEHRFAPLPVDEQVARGYGRLAVTVEGTGRRPRARAMDLLIAATAYVHGARLYTRNAADLRGLEDLVDVVAV